MQGEHDRSAAHWRAILEARWRVRLQEVTELSMAYHGAAADTTGDNTGYNTGDKNARRLLRRAVAARQRLADTEDALGRVTAGAFGRCEQCAAPIAEPLLAAVPETRYCTQCANSVFGALVTGTGAPLVPAARR